MVTASGSRKVLNQCPIPHFPSQIDSNNHQLVVPKQSRRSRKSPEPGPGSGRRVGRKPVSSSQGPQPSGPQSLHLPDVIQGLCTVLRLSCHCPSSGLPSISGWGGGKHLGFAPETCLHSPGPRGPTPGTAAAPPGAFLLGAPPWPRTLSPRDRWLWPGLLCYMRG